MYVLYCLDSDGFPSLTILLRKSLCKINYINLKMYNWWVLTVLYTPETTNTIKIPNISSQSKDYWHPLAGHLSLASGPRQPTVFCHYRLVCIIYIWTHAVWILLYLASLTQPNDSEIYRQCQVCYLFFFTAE